MNLIIGSLEITLPDAQPEFSRLPDSQEDTLKVIWALASVRGDRTPAVETEVFLSLLQIKRIESLMSRLNNLQRKGLLTFRGVAAVA